MDSNCQIWRIWAFKLHQWGLEDLVASFLEAAGPLALIGAQLVYVGQPLLRGLDGADHFQALAKVLEDQKERLSFVQYLRGDRMA